MPINNIRSLNINQPIEGKRNNKIRWAAIIATPMFLLSDSPFSHLLGLPLIVLFTIYFLSFRLLHQKSEISAVSKQRLFLYVVYITTCGISSNYNNTISPMLFGILSVVYMEYIFGLKITELHKIVDISGIVVNISLVFSFMAIAFWAVGLFKIFELDVTVFYPFSFLYPADFKIMRPTGFWHEPGQFSFIICFLVAARHMLGMSTKTNLIMLGCGLITQSLAHLLFTLGYLVLLACKAKGATIKFGAIIITSALMAFAYGGGMSWMTERASNFISTPDSWGRFLSFNNALTILDDSIEKIVFGPKKNLAARQLDEEDQFSTELSQVSVYGENPLSPIIYGGLLAAWPYYLFILYSVVLALKTPNIGFPIFLVALLTLQRPYTTEFPYALMISILIAIAVKLKLRNNEPKRKLDHRESKVLVNRNKLRQSMPG